MRFGMKAMVADSLLETGTVLSSAATATWREWQLSAEEFSIGRRIHIPAVQVGLQSQGQDPTEVIGD